MSHKASKSLLLVALACIPATAFGQASEAVPTIEQDIGQAKRSQIYVVPEYYRLNSDAGVLAGPSIGFGADYEFNDQWAAGVELKHAYSAAGLSGLFVSTIFKARYALTGAFLAGEEKTRIKGWTTVKKQRLHVGGARLEAHVVNYSVFTSQSEIPFSGFGVAASYELIWGPRYSMEPGFALDQTANSRQSVQSMRMFLRLKMRL